MMSVTDFLKKFTVWLVLQILFGVQFSVAAVQDTPPMRYVAGLEEPLVATGRTTAQDDRDLDAAIAAYQNPARISQDFTENAKPFISFVKEHPASAWNMAVQTNLGIGYYHAGYFSRAFAAWEQAWQAGRGATSPEAKALTDRAIGELARMHARVGHAEELERLFAHLGKRKVTGSATEMITGAREGLWMFKNEPGLSYLCGSKALVNLLTALKATPEQIKTVDAARSGRHGFSLVQVAELAQKVGFASKMVYRTAKQPIPVPSVVNWKVHHYAAIIGEKDGLYHIQDPTFASGDLWITKAAIDAEASGYFLVPTKKEAAPSWRDASFAEAQQVYGMGFTNQNQTGATQLRDENLLKCLNSTGMCVANAKTMVVSLNLNDTPVGYQPSKGLPVKIRLTYNQREARQPAEFGFFNVSPKWTLNFLSYIQDDPTTAGISVAHYVAGGGSVDYSVKYSYDTATGAFSPERQGQAVLVRVPAQGALSYYELRMPDGSKHIFSLPNGAVTGTRLVFLTKMLDPAGNALTLNYDKQFRLTSITDATRRNTTFSYGWKGKPLLVSKITDPFGRHADLTYDSAGRLNSITDVIGLKSSFGYDASGLINSMATPYGTSKFNYGEGDSNTRFLEMTDPMGFTESLEFTHEAPINSSESVAPNGIQVINNYLEYRNTFHWDKHAYPLYYAHKETPDYSKARVTHWLHNPDGQTSPIKESTKEPLENRVWYAYPDQSSGYSDGSADTPTAIARVLDNGTTQASHYTYNPFGKPLTVTDPKGSKTVFTYATNNIDVLTVQQTSATGSLSVMARYTYNSQHKPLTYTDAVGRVTRYTYNPAGQVTSVTDALKQVMNYSYDTLGRLTTITDANAKLNASLTYDAFDRVATYTDFEKQQWSYAYDKLDRVTQITHPDKTITKYAYNKLDLVTVTDQRGFVTKYAYDANRRLTSVTDPLGKVTRYAYFETGDPKSITDPNGNTTIWNIDIQDRPITKRSADGAVESYTYNTSGNFASLTDPRKLKTSYSYDVIGNILKTVSPDTKTTQNAYNIAGNLAKTIDARGKQVTYGYDAKNRITKINYGVTPPITFTYDQGTNGIGHLTQMADETGSTTWNYDERGQVLAKVQKIGSKTFTTRYAYDAVGHLTAMQYPSGKMLWFGYTNAKLTQISLAPQSEGNPAASLLGGISYLPTRQVGTWVWGNGEPYIRDYDQKGRLLQYELGKDRKRTLRFDAASRITDYIDGNPAFDQKFGYDKVGRLTQYTAPQVDHRYSYDANGNRTRFQYPQGGSTYTQATDSNRLMSIGGDSTKNYQYYEDGSIETDGFTSYVYDDRGRLTKAGLKFGAEEYKINGLGQRVSKLSYFSNDPNFNTTNFVYDEQGHVIGEYDFYGKPLRETVYLGDIPAAVFTDQGTHYIYADHLNAPRAIANSTGKIVWRWNSGPFGTALPNEDSDGDKKTFTYNLRFPGQYFDATTRLHYNGFRDYDPNTGRYIQSDPIGLAGGINTYGYTYNSPVNRVDFFGLDTIVQIGYTGTPIGSGTYHEFVILTDTVTGESYATRAGPESQSFFGSASNSGSSVSGGSLSASAGKGGSGGIGFGQIYAQSGIYDATFRDYASVQSVQTIGTISRDYSESVSNAIEFSNVTNNNKIPYLPWLNSNSYASTFVQSLTGVRPSSYLWAPGSDYGKPDPNLSYKFSPILGCSK